jgi:Ca-activated chloride channel family protein
VAALLFILSQFSARCSDQDLRPPSETVKILFTYGSEKKTWIEEVTKQFNAEGHQIPGGERIEVESQPDGSNVIVTEALEGIKRPHLISPASNVFIKDANGRAQELGQPVLINQSEARPLVVSPLVIAIWKDRAEAMGWPGKPLGWRDFFDYIANPDEWKAIRKGAWGSFKYGHTHPDYSNSGILALLAQFYAGLNQYDARKVKLSDVRQKAAYDYVSRIESATVHYGESTGFFAEKMFDQGSQYLTAAILYENLVYEANKKKAKPGEPPKVVAIYPVEGTFPNDHPVGIVNRDWVSPKERAAAEIYIEYLLRRPQQERALASGFRPVDKTIPIAGVLKPEFGVDASKFNQETALDTPSYQVIKETRILWRKYKRPADIVLAIDTSGSMKGEKIRSAEEAAKEFIKQLSDGDSLSIILFSTEADFVRNEPFVMSNAGKAEAIAQIQGLDPDGATAFNQAVNKGFTFLESRDPKRNRALVVLSDGKDTQRGVTQEQLLDQIYNDGEKNIYIFTIGYGDGKDLDPEMLKKVAGRTLAKYYKADPKTVRKTLREIVTFF